MPLTGTVFGIIALVARSAGNFALIDSRFSDGNLTISKTLEFAPQLGWQLFLVVSGAVFVLAVLACLAFTVAATPLLRLSTDAARSLSAPRSYIDAVLSARPQPGVAPDPAGGHAR